MQVEKTFKELPPREPLTTLEAMVRDFKWRFGPKGKYAATVDTIVPYCRQAGSLKEAIYRACRSVRPNGKRHNHQSRVPAIKLERLADNVYDQWSGSRNTFEAVLQAVRVASIPGIGPVTQYDVTVRICAFLGLEPRHVYLHANVRNGWNTLCNQLGLAIWKDKIPHWALPEALRSLKADEVEDFLCTYSQLFWSLS